MPASRKSAKSAPKVDPIFTDTREFITRYSVLPDPEADVVTMFSIGTWAFSPMCQWPATYPYLYLTGQAGSGKTVLGQDCLGVTCRMWKSATGATGPTLFRMLGREDEETGEIENFAPTLVMDEIDATFSGSKDEPLRLSLNVGYKRGATIPRSAGKTSIDFPIYGPKVMMGIDNGHLPETVTQRSIRIELERRTQDELTEAGVQPFFVFDVEDEAAELQERLSAWAKTHSMVLRDYRPNPPKGLTARQWEISRSLVQLAHALGIEDRIVRSLVTVFNRSRGKLSAKERLYRVIDKLFTDTPGLDRVTSKALLAHLSANAVSVPGNSMKGMSSVLNDDGISPQNVRLKPDHPHFVQGESDHPRGYYRHQFDEAIIRYVPEDED